MTTTLDQHLAHYHGAEVKPQHSTALSDALAQAAEDRAAHAVPAQRSIRDAA